MEALRASLEKTGGKRAQPKAAAADTVLAELKAASRKPPRKIAAEPETRRKVAKR
jgi:hypothetical protein